MTDRFDVVVVGGGLIGLVAAESLTRPGKRVGYVPAGSASTLTSHALLMSNTNPLYVDMAWKGVARWSALSKRAGQALLRLTGGWECGAENSSYFEAVRDNFINYPIPFEDLTLGKNYVRFPHFFLEPGEEAIYYMHGGVVETAKAQGALQTMMASAGVVGFPAGLDALIPLEDMTRLIGTDGTEWTTAQLVLLDTPDLLPQVRLTLPLERRYVRVVEFAALLAYRAGYEMGQMAVLVDRSEVSRPVMATPHKDYPAGHHLIWPTSTRPDEVTDAQISTFARRRLPYLDPRPGGKHTHTFTTLPDDTFVLDFHPDFSHILIGAGFGYHGTALASVLGETVSQMMQGVAPRINTDFFSLGRFV